MVDKGIIFSAPMVRAMLAGTKTQTRRLLRNPEYYGCPTGDCPHAKQAECDQFMAALTAKEANGYAVGDRLYVREHWKVDREYDPFAPVELTELPSFDGVVCYLATAPEESRRDPVWGKHRQGMHMPRWASRLWLEVTEVRVERLQSISHSDAEAEGLDYPRRHRALSGFPAPMASQAIAALQPGQRPMQCSGTPSTPSPAPAGKTIRGSAR